MWYTKRHPLSLALRPFGYLYAMLMRIRRMAYRVGALRSHHVNALVIVVGNVAVGGTGKTPLVIALAGHLAQQGWRPGIVCRGYAGKAQRWPQPVDAHSDAATVGDEAVLIARRTDCPVAAAGGRRVQAARELIAAHGCNLIISDDGLQHLALQRDIEIVLIDGERRHGNGQCLPAGPLREPLARLASADMLVTNTTAPDAVHGDELPMQLIAGAAVNLLDAALRKPLCEFNDQQVHAVAGIGHPARFFRMLERAGLRAIPHAFADHHNFIEDELQFGDELAVLMTEKDAVKCGRFADSKHWYVPVTAQLPAAFFERLRQLLPARTAHSDEAVA